MATLCMKHEWVNAGFTSMKEVCKHCDIPREEWEAKKAAAFNPAGRYSTPSTDGKPVFDPLGEPYVPQIPELAGKKTQVLVPVAKQKTITLESGKSITVIARAPDALHIAGDIGDFQVQLIHLSGSKPYALRLIQQDGHTIDIDVSDLLNQGDAGNEQENQESQGAGQGKEDRDADRD